MVDTFNVSAYMGRWHELLRYPVPFQKNATYNTTADYKLLESGSVDVVNTTYENETEMTAHGIAYPLGSVEFRVDFDDADISKFLPDTSKRLSEPIKGVSKPNYIIHRIWKDDKGNYSFVVVTNANRDALWLLSREKRPSKVHYQQVLKFVSQKYDSNKFILTPHYD